MTDDRPRSRGHHVRALVLGAVGLTSAMLLVPVFVGHNKPDQFCTLGLPIEIVDRQTVVLQDQGKPGRHEERDEPCSADYGPNGIAGVNKLGFDCKLRDANGVVVGSSKPNRTDGTCGQAE